MSTSNTFIHAYDTLPVHLRELRSSATVNQLQAVNAISLKISVTAFWAVIALGWGGLGCGEFGPDSLPVVGAQVLQGRAWVVLVPAPCENWADNLDLPEHLIDVLLINAQVLGNFAAAFWCVVWKGHTTYSSYGLAFVKPMARFIF